jgi:hypothetical protein
MIQPMSEVGIFCCHGVAVGRRGFQAPETYTVRNNLVPSLVPSRLWSEHVAQISAKQLRGFKILLRVAP